MRIFCDWRHKWSSFWVILAHVSWPRAQLVGQSVSLKISLETGLESESFEPLIDFLAFLVQKLWSKINKLTNYLIHWFPTGGLRLQSGSRRSFCGVVNSSLNSFLKSRIFRTSYVNILLHQQNRNTDRSLWSSHYLRQNSYLISPTQLKSTWL